MTEILTMMTNFSKKSVALALMILLFPVLWPIYAVYELSCKSRVTRDDCVDVQVMWVLGTIVYAFACMVLCAAYFGIITIYNAGYMEHALMGLGAVLAIFIAPDVLYYIFKITKK